MSVVFKKSFPGLFSSSLYLLTSKSLQLSPSVVHEQASAQAAKLLLGRQNPDFSPDLRIHVE